MYKIKQQNPDFRVREIINIQFSDHGEYQYFKLIKDGLSTPEAISILSEKLGIPKKLFGYAGNKDKHALTEQVMSIRSNRNIERIDSHKIKLEFLGTGNERINLGTNQGNGFEIVVRNIDSNKEIPQKVSQIPNYFDEQRFSKKNFEVGMLLLKKDYASAVGRIISSGAVDEKLRDHLEKNPNDYIGTLKKIDRKVLSLYVNSVQSLIFNETLSEYIRKTSKAFSAVKYLSGEFCFPAEVMENIELPLVGFGNEDIDAMAAKTMQQLGISQRDFIFREIPGLSSEGTMRKAFISIANLEISDFDDDELNAGKKKCMLKFSLPKGSYATIVVKSLFG